VRIGRGPRKMTRVRHTGGVQAPKVVVSAAYASEACHQSARRHDRFRYPGHPPGGAGDSERVARDFHLWSAPQESGSRPGRMPWPWGTEPSSLLLRLAGARAAWSKGHHRSPRRSASPTTPAPLTVGAPAYHRRWREGRRTASRHPNKGISWPERSDKLTVVEPRGNPTSPQVSADSRSSLCLSSLRPAFRTLLAPVRTLAQKPTPYLP